MTDFEKEFDEKWKKRWVSISVALDSPQAIKELKFFIREALHKQAQSIIGDIPDVMGDNLELKKQLKIKYLGE